jgi:hypothetical protein
MSERHQLIVDRHEGDRSVVEVDGAGFADVPRWLLPTAARGDDVIAVIVQAEPDRTVVTLQRDPAATARARDAAKDIVERLKRRDPGGDVRL